MHLSPANPRGLFGVDFKKPIYLHIYKGVKPNNYYIEHLKNTVNKNYPALNVEVVKSDAHYQGGQHRVIIGPIAAEELMPISRAFLIHSVLKNFPVYYENDQISLVTRPTSRLNKSEPKSQQNFEHSAALQSTASTLANEGNRNELDELVLEKTLQYIESKTESYIQQNASDWLSQYGTTKVKVDLDRNFQLRAGEFEFLFPFYESSRRQCIHFILAKRLYCE